MENYDSEYNQCVVPDLQKWMYYFNDLTLYRVNNLLKQLDNLRIAKIIYPDQHNTLRIFKDMKPSDVKVIILGQDPYFDGNATGYAFACKNHISPSLHHIFKSMNKNYTLENADISLEYLVEQGVMLLNTALTVRKDKPNSHRNIGWTKFTQEFLKNFSEHNKNVIYLLWGANAKKYKHLINKKDNLILEDVHPSYASRNDRDWNCLHFKKTNEYLKKHNKTIIKWM